MTKAYQTANPAIKEKWHKKFEHVNNNNLIIISKMAIKISFLKDNTNMEPDFYKAYTLTKQYKVYNKKSSIDNINELSISLYADLFGEKNTLSGIRNY